MGKEVQEAKCKFCQGLGVVATKSAYERWNKILDAMIESVVRGEILKIGIYFAVKSFRSGKRSCSWCYGTGVIQSITAH